MTNRQGSWRNLSLQEAIGQMLVVRASGYLFDNQIRYPTWETTSANLNRWIEELNIGGIILLGASAPELWLRVQQLQEKAKIPLLIAADIEEGLGHRFAGATWFPPPMSIGAIAKQDLDLAIKYATKLGEITATEAIAVGINWILAPVVDVNNNPDNPVINVRSFGDTPEIVSHLANAFIKGAKKYPVLTTAKHFPGHGDTKEDSHLDLPLLSHPELRLESLELLPFAKAIAAGVDSVMSAHLLISAWDEHRPATLSRDIITGQLKERLGFNGLVVTDALVMGGVAKYASPEEVALMAIEAGADILLMPEDPEKTIAAILEAVRCQRLSEERIEASLERIWQAKNKVSFPTPVASSSFNLISQLARPEALETVAAITRDSLLTGGKIPIQPDPNGGRNILLVDDATDCSDFLARHTPAVDLPKKLGYEPQLLDRSTLVLPPPDSRSILLQIFLRGNPFRGSSRLSTNTEEWLKELLKKDSLQALSIYGSPYIMESLSKDTNLPWVFCYGQMPQAQAIVCKTLFDLSNFVNLETREAFI